MGLDQYAYAAARAGQNDEWWGEYDKSEDQKTVAKPIEIAYWRKHPNLHGWMEQLWNSKGRPGLEQYHNNTDLMFNGIELELTWEDLDQLEEDINKETLPHTEGFFFGSPADNYYREQDLEFVRKARAEIFSGLKVFYNSSW
jgi:hypothetical protein